MTTAVQERGAAAVAAAPPPILSTTKAAEILGWPINRVIDWADSGRLPCTRGAQNRREISAAAVAELAGFPTTDIPPDLEIYHRGSPEPEDGIAFDACGDEWVRCDDGLWRLADALSDMALHWEDLVVEFYPVVSRRWP